MTLVITLVTPHGVWASTDRRLREHPSGKLITDSSVKHVLIKCLDGAALVSYTGLGRVGRIDVSTWMREILRGEERTVNQTLIDLQEQATARLGIQAKTVGVRHAFLAGAFLGGQPWAAQIVNWRPPSAFSAGGIQPMFETAAVKVEGAVLQVAGSGRDAVAQRDVDLLLRIGHRRPRRPEDFMTLLGEVSRRAAESGHRAAGDVSRSCTVVFMPPSGDPVKQEWYGPDEERHLAPPGFSHVLMGIDLAEMSRPFWESGMAYFDGRITEDEFNRRGEEAAKRSVLPQGRRNKRPADSSGSSRPT